MVLVFMVIVTVIVVAKVCSKKKVKYASSDLPDRNTHTNNMSESNDYSDTVEYEEPTWAQNPSKAIKVKPNVVYFKK